MSERRDAREAREREEEDWRIAKARKEKEWSQRKGQKNDGRRRYQCGERR